MRPGAARGNPSAGLLPRDARRSEAEGELELRAQRAQRFRRWVEHADPVEPGIHGVGHEHVEAREVDAGILGLAPFGQVAEEVAEGVAVDADIDAQHALAGEVGRVVQSLSPVTMVARGRLGSSGCMKKTSPAAVTSFASGTMAWMAGMRSSGVMRSSLFKFD